FDFIRVRVGYIGEYVEVGAIEGARRNVSLGEPHHVAVERRVGDGTHSGRRTDADADHCSRPSADPGAHPSRTIPRSVKARSRSSDSPPPCLTNSARSRSPASLPGSASTRIDGPAPDKADPIKPGTSAASISSSPGTNVARYGWCKRSRIAARNK